VANNDCQIYECRVYHPSGKLKKIVKAETLVDRLYKQDTRSFRPPKKKKKYQRTCRICGKVTIRATNQAVLCGASKCVRANRKLREAKIRKGNEKA